MIRKNGLIAAFSMVLPSTASALQTDVGSRRRKLSRRRFKAAGARAGAGRPRAGTPAPAPAPVAAKPAHRGDPRMPAASTGSRSRARSSKRAAGSRCRATSCSISTTRPTSTRRPGSGSEVVLDDLKQFMDENKARIARGPYRRAHETQRQGTPRRTSNESGQRALTIKKYLRRERHRSDADPLSRRRLRSDQAHRAEHDRRWPARRTVRTEFHVSRRPSTSRATVVEIPRRRSARRRQGIQLSPRGFPWPLIRRADGLVLARVDVVRVGPCRFSAFSK